jgi:hypothetical protein
MALLTPEREPTWYCTPKCMSTHPHRTRPAITCPACTRRLYTWAGPGHPMPHHYQAIPGIGAWCPAPTAPASHPVPTQG